MSDGAFPGHMLSKAAERMAAASFLAFAVLYTLVYRATSTAYYHIVSDGGDR